MFTSVSVQSDQVCFHYLTYNLFNVTGQFNKDTNYLHLNAILYRLFFRLYAMYPCNFIFFLQEHYGLGCHKNNSVIYSKTIEPMLGNFRFHPLLISSSKEKECDKKRFFYKDHVDHVDDCLQYAIDPIEYFSEADHADQLSTEDNNYVDDGDDDEELCQLTNSTPDKDELTLTSPVLEKHSSLETNDFEDEPNRDAIFNQINDTISNDKWSNVTLLDKADSQTPTGNFKVAAEFAEEAISLSSKKALSKNGVSEASSQKISSMRNVNKPVLVPVAIDPVSKTPSLGALQRKNIGKAVCVSPFKPIRENDSLDIKILNNNKSPANFHSNLSHSLGAKTANEDTEEIDLEIMQLYNRENKQSDLTKDDSSFFLQPETKTKTVPTKSDLFMAKQKTAEQASSSTQFDAELVGNIKNSFKKANSRIRYQSHCLPETEKEPSDYYYISHESPSGLSSVTRVLCKSCPILYFSDIQEKRLSIDENSKTVALANSNPIAAGQNTNQATDVPIKASASKSKVNLILENPDRESKKLVRSLSLKKTCKSVDHTKEARHKFFSRHESYPLNKYPSIDSKGRSDLYESTSSIDIPRKTDPMHWKCTPHEMLDQMLLLNLDCNFKKSDQSEGGSCRLRSSRDSALNSTYSTEQFTLSNSSRASLSSTEEGWRKQLMFMTVHLMFERHQRDLVVIRNRRLYKNLKESIKLEEQVLLFTHLFYCAAFDINLHIFFAKTQTHL